jgi:hypothetical protein
MCRTLESWGYGVLVAFSGADSWLLAEYLNLYCCGQVRGPLSKQITGVSMKPIKANFVKCALDLVTCVARSQGKWGKEFNNRIVRQFRHRIVYNRYNDKVDELSRLTT